VKHGKFHRATTFVVTGMFVFVLAWTEGCGGYVTRGSGSGGNSIAGTVVDDQTMSPVAGAVVVLEQVDGSGIDRVISFTTSGSNGSFSFNPSASGLYDVVTDSTATSATGGTLTYAATVTFGVPAGASLNQIPLVPEFGNTSPTGIPATIFGTVSSSGNSVSFQNKVDVQLSALQSVSPAVGSVSLLTIPVFGSSTTSITTVTGTSCMNGTTCANYTLLVPEGDFSVGMFSTSGTLYNKSTQQHTQGVNYTVEGKASFPTAPLSPDCTPSSTSSAISVSSGTLGTGDPSLTFKGCF
jgi:hypothetical protein